MGGGGLGDTADYSARLNPVTVSLDGAGNDGEASEGDNVLADVEDVRPGLRRSTPRLQRRPRPHP